MGATPDYNGQIASIWGSIYDGSTAAAWLIGSLGVASGVAYGSNPPYTINDLALIYPFFIGAPTNIAACVTDGTTGIILTPNTTGLVVGALVTGPGVPAGSFITAINTGVSFTISNITTAAATVALAGYAAPPIPFVVINVYLVLAAASILQSNYNDAWYMCMALFIAHYCTLWAMNNQSPNATIGQIAQSGMAAGLQIFKHAGDLSVNQQILDDLKGWGTYQLTSYGQQLATIAMVVNSRSMLIY